VSSQEDVAHDQFYYKDTFWTRVKLNIPRSLKAVSQGSD